MAHVRNALGFGLIVLLGSVATAFGADSTDPSRPPTPGTPSGEVNFDCRFAGTFAGKSGGGMDCRARGRINVLPVTDFEYVIGDPNDFLRVECGEDFDLYKGGVTYGQVPTYIGNDRDDDRGPINAVITGLTTIAPTILVSDIRLKHIHPHEDYSAALNFNRFGMQTMVTGTCRFKPEAGPDPLR